MNMELKDIQNLIKFVAKSGASEVKLEMEDIKITIKTGAEKSETTILQQAPMGMQQMPVAAPAVQAPATVAEASSVGEKVNAEASNYIEITSPIKLVNDVLQYYPDVNKYYADLISPIITYLPNHWLSDSLYWMVNDNIEKAILPMLLQIILALLLTSIALFLGKKWYYSVWLTSSKFKFSNTKGTGVFSKLGSFNNASRFIHIYERPKSGYTFIHSAIPHTLIYFQHSICSTHCGE